LRLSNAAGIALAVLLLMPGFTAARTSGLSAGDSAVFSYQILTTYRISGGGNRTTIMNNQFTVDILSVNTSAPLGYLTYTMTIDVVNNASLTTTHRVSNATTIFDPYNNDSYLGNIGFFPFTYTDLQPGRANRLELYLAFGGGVFNQTLPGSIARVNASVARPEGLININYTLYNINNTRPIRTVMSFNATTGVLQRARTWAVAFSVEKIFTYDLLSFNHPTKLDLSFLWYFVLAGVVVFVVYAVATSARSTKHEKKVARMRKKLEGPAKAAGR
jgi:hypothetical protein